MTDQSVRLIDIVTVIALVVGPAISVLIGQWLQRRAYRRAQKEGVFSTLMITRGDRLSSEHIRGLAQIDVVFSKSKSVRERWVTYYNSLNNPGLSDLNGSLQRQNYLYDMLIAMAHDLGYSKSIGFAEITRSYKPQHQNDEVAAQVEVRKELVRVLKASENMGTPRKQS